MPADPAEIAEFARLRRFDRATVEHVARMLGVLIAIRDDPVVGPRLALKGGSALNLFLRDAPRLSIDLDLNVVGPPQESGASEREEILRSLEDLLDRAGWASVQRVRTLGGFAALRARPPSGRGPVLQLDLAYRYRVSLWETQELDSRVLPSARAEGIRVVNGAELVAGKLLAALTRGHPRDVFDIADPAFATIADVELVRIALVVYSAGSETFDLRRSLPDDVRIDAISAQESLIPMLGRTAEMDDIEEWVSDLEVRARTRLEDFVPLRPGEREFLTSLLDGGRVDPEHLTSDAELQARIRHHPAVLFRTRR